MWYFFTTIHPQSNEMIERVPKHIAIIPDGNRRWGKKLGLAPWEGHMEGRKTFENIVRTVFDAGIPYFTFWAASVDNLIKRQQIERKWLRILFQKQLEDKEMEKALMERNVCFRVIGRWQQYLSDKEGLVARVAELEKMTAKNTSHHLTILFGYDGKSEMIAAYEKLAKSGDPINPDSFREALWTGHLPDVDLIIRTGEEKEGWLHWSAGFMMWLAANAEIRPLQTLWPDFSEDRLKQILAEYGTRERRLGA